MIGVWAEIPRFRLHGGREMPGPHFDDLHVPTLLAGFDHRIG